MNHDDDENEIICDDEKLKFYEIKKIVGNGEFCDVYKAYNKQTNQTVALKRLKMRQQMFNGQARIECLKEIQILRKLKHPNIIQHIESFCANNEFFIALEYADAGDLAKMLEYLRENNKFLTENSIRRFFLQICSGLAFMHSKSIMHRDIKPANVLIKRDRTVKLADFGFSRLLSANTLNARTLVGTPYYMAPERLAELNYCFPADIWSLGCLLYELITLYPPFYQADQTMQNLVEKIQNLQYKPINDDYSQDFRTIITDCLLLKPEDRLDIGQILVILKQHQQPSSDDDNQLADQNHQQQEQQNSDDESMARSVANLNAKIGPQDHNPFINNFNNYNNHTHLNSDQTNHQSSTFKLKRIYKNFKKIF